MATSFIHALVEGQICECRRQAGMVVALSVRDSMVVATRPATDDEGKQLTLESVVEQMIAAQRQKEVQS